MFQNLINNNRPRVRVGGPRRLHIGRGPGSRGPSQFSGSEITRKREKLRERDALLLRCLESALASMSQDCCQGLLQDCHRRGRLGRLGLRRFRDVCVACVQHLMLQYFAVPASLTNQELGLYARSHDELLHDVLGKLLSLWYSGIPAARTASASSL